MNLAGIELYELYIANIHAGEMKLIFRRDVTNFVFIYGIIIIIVTKNID